MTKNFESNRQNLVFFAPPKQASGAAAATVTASMAVRWGPTSTKILEMAAGTRKRVELAAGGPARRAAGAAR